MLIPFLLISLFITTLGDLLIHEHIERVSNGTFHGKGGSDDNHDDLSDHNNNKQTTKSQERKKPKHENDQKSGTFRVMDWNIFYDDSIDLGFRVKKLVKHINALNPDILGIHDARDRDIISRLHDKLGKLISFSQPDVLVLIMTL